MAAVKHIATGISYVAYQSLAGRTYTRNQLVALKVDKLFDAW